MKFQPTNCCDIHDPKRGKCPNCGRDLKEYHRQYRAWVAAQLMLHGEVFMHEGKIIDPSRVSINKDADSTP
jgi:hypothetical protein